MLKTVKYIVGILWLFATILMTYFAHILIKAETDPQKTWAWFVMWGFSFISITLLTYNIMTARGKKQH
ncbi:MAG: hypothetical protein HY746_09420 [Elusimicrobia bacterium]|nr:hypothetical protein [Elusimicrobiota bacterium]